MKYFELNKIFSLFLIFLSFGVMDVFGGDDKVKNWGDNVLAEFGDESDPVSSAVKEKVGDLQTPKYDSQIADPKPAPASPENEASTGGKPTSEAPVGNIHAGATTVNDAAAANERRRLELIEADRRKMQDEARKRWEAAKKEAERQKKLADAQNARRLEQERIDKALREAKAALDRDKNIPRSTLNGIDNQIIRENLVNAVAAQELKKRLEAEKKRSEISLAQLLQMAAITMQAATAMNSMNGTSPVQSNAQPYDITQPVAPKAALGRSPASFGDKKGTISNKSDGPELAEGESAAEGDAKSVKDKETLAKIKAEVEAAEKRKKIQAMRLKQKLRDKLRAQGKDGAVDTDELFGGSLNQGMESANADDATEESVAKDSGMSASNIYQAVREGFSLAGAETDREVGELVSEAERDLSSEDMSAGVLGRESPSLFARVRAVHQACQRDKCVLSN